MGMYNVVIESYIYCLLFDGLYLMTVKGQQEGDLDQVLKDGVCFATSFPTLTWAAVYSKN